MIWLFIIVLTSIAIGMLAMSLRARNYLRQGSDSIAAIYADQLAELDRDVAKGMVSELDAKAARTEIKRNILRQTQAGSSALHSSKRVSRFGIGIAMLFVPIVAVGYYTQFGNPALSNVTLAEQRETREERSQVVALTEQLKTRLKTDSVGGPNEGWLLLGQTYMRLGQFADAVDAFSVVSMRSDAASSAFSMLTEALVAQENGIMTPAAQAAIDKAAVLDPTNPAVTYYRALSLQQSGQSAEAHKLIVARLEAADGFYPWMETLVAQANQIGAGIGRAPLSLEQFAPMLAGRGPSAEEVAAAEDMSAEDRAKFIQSMVQRLADRLAEEPSDLDGWLRLGRAYTVLGDEKSAKAAYHKASKLSVALSASDPRKSLADNALNSLGQ